MTKVVLHTQTERERETQIVGVHTSKVGVCGGRTEGAEKGFSVCGWKCVCVCECVSVSLL